MQTEDDEEGQALRSSRTASNPQQTSFSKNDDKQIIKLLSTIITFIILIKVKFIKLHFTLKLNENYAKKTNNQ